MSAFGLKDMAKTRGIAPHQPSPHIDTLPSAITKGFLLMTALIVMQIAFACSAQNSRIHSETFFLIPGEDSTKQFVSQPFDIPRGTSNLQVSAEADVLNQWVNLGITLVNVDTNEAVNFDQEVAFYTGQDSDGTWVEGSTRSRTVLSSVKGGKYILTIDHANLENISSKQVRIAISRNVFFMGNFWLGLAYVFCLPVLLVLLHIRFERGRWESSDYSPYH